jgi:RHS repeat-associated protein
MSTWRWFFVFLALCRTLPIMALESNSFVSAESDPDAWIQDCVSVINGAYRDSTTDLCITGPDALILQRLYNTKNPFTDSQDGVWKIFPERFLVVGKDPSGKVCNGEKSPFEWTSAFAGERSGEILHYTGWRHTQGMTKDPLVIDILNNATGVVNTYSKEISGQTNRQNHLLHCKSDVCELILGDGTKRIYKKVQVLPSLLLGEESNLLMAAQVLEPCYFLLSQEILPSGNQLFFSYDAAGHLIAVEMEDRFAKKSFSWIHIDYEFGKEKCQIHFETSDERHLTYSMILNEDTYQLVKVEGFHSVPVSYEYAGALNRKIFPEGRFIELEYQDGRVCTLKRPNAQSGKEEVAYAFSYGENYTDVFDAAGLKTRYIYDKRFQLTSTERYDENNTLYRVDEKFWGKAKADAGLLLAVAVRNGNRRICSYRSFEYDKSGNVIAERLYGNLTGKQDVNIKVSSDGKLLNPDDVECHLKTFSYSTDGFNLLTKMGDCKENQILYAYKPGTNLLVRKLIFDKMNIKKRLFQYYDNDGVCVKIIEDDGSQEEESRIYGWRSITERHIKEIRPKETLPGVGLPEMIEERALDLKRKQEVLVNRFINTYDAQSNLLSCSTYDANGQYAFAEKRTYSAIGKIVSQTDAMGREEIYGYDEIGNQTSHFIPHENKLISTIYDFHNQSVQITEVNADEEYSLYNSYDILGRKISSSDRYGNATHYEYDAFSRLTKIIHPQVLDENGQITCPTFTYAYDIFGNVLKTIDSKGFITSKVYNLRGDPTRISYPDGSFELFKYDTEGSLHRSLTREQIITVYEYDYLGRSIYEESSTASEEGVSSFFKSNSHQYNGFRCTCEKGDDNVKRYYFDHVGRISSLIEYRRGQDERSPDSRLMEFFYDSLGRIHKRLVWFDAGPKDYSVECYEYDLSGNIIEKRMEDGEGNILLQQCYAYDLQDQCIEEYAIDNDVKTTIVKTTYNAQREPIAFLDGLDHETKIVIDNKHLNALGQTVLKKTVVNPLGVQTEIEFDALGRICSLSKKDSFGVLLSSQSITYDALGNKACEIHDQIVDGEICGSQKTRWVYGPMGRLEEEVQAADSSLARRIRYEYNSSGKLITKTLSGMAAAPIQYAYNKDGRLQKIEAQDGKKERGISNTYSYDRRGNILSAYSLHGKSVQRTYNAYDQVIQETIKDGEGTYMLQYAYDRKGRLKELILPDHSKVVYGFDAAFGREVNRVSPQGNVLYTHTYDHYDRQGKLLNENHIRYAGGHKYSYDSNGQKISNQSEFFNEEYSRDALGRLLEIKGERQEEYAYNSLSQLVEEKKAISKNYSYDSLDNRIRTDRNELIYNALNQLTSHSKTEFSYDSQGNLLRKVLDGEETRFESNILSQLISIEKADQTALVFSYDPFGRLLVEKHLDTKGKNKKTLSSTRYLYLGHQEIGTLSQSGAIETLKIPGLHGDELASTSIAFEIKDETYVPLHDISGNVISLIDPLHSQVVESYQYTAFGEETIFNANGEQIENSAVGNPWRFAEKRVNQTSGLILFGLRFYDPAMGRWISEDPAGGIDGPNLYTYLHNNPLSHLDRFGLVTESLAAKIFGSYFFGEVESHCFCEKHRTCKRGGDIGPELRSGFPKIRYCTYFEQMYPKYERSKRYDLSDLDPLTPLADMGIGFTNGIWNNFEMAKESTQYLSRLSGGYNIYSVYNATHGTIPDCKECKMGMSYIATDPVLQLHQMWNSFFEKSSADAKFLMICHSQGAIHVRNALLDYSPELRKRILVVAIAPAAYIYQETCAKVIHYRAAWWRDFVPRFDRKGARREKDAIVTLDSHQDAPFFDHEFMSPTYQRELRKHIANYVSTNGKTL